MFVWKTFVLFSPWNVLFRTHAFISLNHKTYMSAANCYLWGVHRWIFQASTLLVLWSWLRVSGTHRSCIFIVLQLYNTSKGWPIYMSHMCYWNENVCYHITVIKGSFCYFYNKTFGILFVFFLDFVFHLSKVSGGLSSSSAAVSLICPSCTAILQQMRVNTDEVSKKTKQTNKQVFTHQLWITLGNSSFDTKQETVCFRCILTTEIYKLLKILLKMLHLGELGSWLRRANLEISCTNFRWAEVGNVWFDNPK